MFQNSQDAMTTILKKVATLESELSKLKEERLLIAHALDVEPDADLPSVACVTAFLAKSFEKMLDSYKEAIIKEDLEKN